MFHSKTRSEQSHTSRARRLRPSPAFVVSMIALLIALSGTALALPGTNTVNSGDIVDETIKSIDLKDNQAVASSDVIDQTLTESDVAPDSLTGASVAPDSIQAQDLAPNSVQSSELGDIQSSYNYVLVAGGAAENAHYVTDSVTVNCPAGTQLISGNGYWYNQQSGEELFISGVQENHANQSVTVTGGNDAGIDRYLGAVANCL